jgi:hypothetical protein
MTEQRTARSVRAHARRAKQALVLQVVVAAVALTSTVWFGFRIATQNEQLERGAEALEHVQRALQFLGALQPRHAEAVIELRLADGLLSESLDGPRRSLLQVLAEAQYGSDDVSGAIATIQRVLALPATRAEDDVVPRILLAKYQCAAGEIELARGLIVGDFAARHRDTLLGEDGFRRACAPLVAELTAEVSSTSTTPPPVADPLFKVRLVFLHVRGDRDRAAAIRVAQGLCDTHGYSVPGIEHVAPARDYPQGGDVRYYHAAQKAEAEEIARHVGALLAAEQWSDARLEVRPLVGYDALPQDRVEVWLPARSGAVAEASPSGTADARFGCFSPADAKWLVERLDSDSREERLRAGQVVANRVKDGTDTEILEALLGELSLPRLGELSAAGRLNVLYMLNVRPEWSGALGARLGERLDEAEARASTGVAIGSQTRDCIRSLREKLGGQRGSDTCGGL